MNTLKLIEKRQSEKKLREARRGCETGLLLTKKEGSEVKFKSKTLNCRGADPALISLYFLPMIQTFGNLLVILSNSSPAF